MTEHITDDVLAQLARPDQHGAGGQEHLERCTDCRTRMAVWQNIGSAVRAEAEEQAVTPPSFDALLAPALAGAPSRSEAPRAVPAGQPVGRGMSWRTAWQLTLRQAALMPRIWAPLSAVGLVGAALLASARVQDGFGVRLFGAVVVLLVILGALMVASPRRDPRREDDEDSQGRRRDLCFRRQLVQDERRLRSRFPQRRQEVEDLLRDGEPDGLRRRSGR